MADTVRLRIEFEGACVVESDDEDEAVTRLLRAVNEAACSIGAMRQLRAFNIIWLDADEDEDDIIWFDADEDEDD